MHRKASLFLIFLFLLASVSCTVESSSTTTTTTTTLSSETETVTTTEDGLSQFTVAMEAFLDDFETHPTWYYESFFHLYENGFASNEGVWYYDKYTIDFSIPYAYRHIDTNSEPIKIPARYETYLHEIYEAVNGCLAARRPRGVGVFTDSFRAETATKESMLATLPAQPVAILALLTNDDIERISDTHYRVTMEMNPFLDFSEFVAHFDGYKHHETLDYTQEYFLIDVYFETDQLRIVAMAQNYDSYWDKTYDFSTTIYIRRISEVTPFASVTTVDYFCPPDDPRLIAEPATVPLSLKVYLREDVYGFVRVDLEPGTYQIYEDDIYPQYTSTYVQLFDADMMELWGNRIVVTTPSTYYIRLECPYDNNITRLYVVPVV